MRCREKDVYHLWLTLLLAIVRRRRKDPLVVSPDLFALPEDFEHLYLVASRPYCTREFNFGFRVREHQKIFDGRRSVESSSVRSPDRGQVVLLFSVLVDVVRTTDPVVCILVARTGSV